MLAERLYKEGLEVLLDQYERAGTSLSRFMTNGLVEADKVLIVGTPEYKKKAETKGTGAAFEEQIIKIDMMDDLDTTKFIPILRKGSFPASFTKLIRERIGFIFSDDTKFESVFQELVDELYGKSKRPEKEHEIQWTISLNEEQISGTYFGPLKDGKPEGIGHFIGKEVDYKGEFREGLFHGQGKISWSKEFFLEGIFEDGLFISGRGKRNWPYNEEGEFIYGKLSGNGSRFIDGGYEKGEFKYGELHGKGKRLLDENVFEEGEFINGKLNGPGKRTMYDEDEVEEGVFKDGVLYGKDKRMRSDGDEGTFSGGELNGRCRIRSSDGQVIDGVFKGGLLNGRGIITYSNGVEAEGVFMEGDLNGQGKITYPDRREVKGKFEHGILYRGNKKIYQDGQVDEGIIETGELNGKGKITYPDGRVVEGLFWNGNFLCQSRLSYRDGTVEEGKFGKGKLHGQGKRTYPDGRVEEGEFENGKLIKKKE
jgi:hypothetical protein